MKGHTDEHANANLKIPTDPSIVFDGCDAVVMQLAIENEPPELHACHEKGVVHVALQINTEPSVLTVDLLQFRQVTKENVKDLMARARAREREKEISQVLFSRFLNTCSVMVFLSSLNDER